MQLTVQGKTGVYQVQRSEFGWSCTCPAFRYCKVPQGGERVCKHIHGVRADLGAEAR